MDMAVTSDQITNSGCEASGSAVFGGGQTLRDELINKWIRTIARRRLTEAEQLALLLEVYAAESGAQELRKFGFTALPQRGKPFEAVTWQAVVRELEVLALLCTPSQIQFVKTEDSSSVVVVVQVLSGVLLHADAANTNVFSVGNVAVFRPIVGMRLLTRGVFSAICVTLPTREKEARAKLRFTREKTRLLSVIELGKACLVAQLDHQMEIDKDARILRELLVIEQTPEEGTTCAGSAELIRKQVLSLIEWEHTDPDFSVQRIVSTLEISRRQLYRSFSTEPDSVAVLILNKRLETSVEILNFEPRVSIEEVARRSGFSSSDQYRRAFRRRYGTTPVHFRSSQIRDSPSSPPTV